MDQENVHEQNADAWVNERGLLLLSQRIGGSIVKVSFIQLYHRFLLISALHGLWLAFSILCCLLTCSFLS